MHPPTLVVLLASACLLGCADARQPQERDAYVGVWTADFRELAELAYRNYLDELRDEAAGDRSDEKLKRAARKQIDTWIRDAQLEVVLGPSGEFTLRTRGLYAASLQTLTGEYERTDAGVAWSADVGDGVPLQEPRTGTMRLDEEGQFHMSLIRSKDAVGWLAFSFEVALRRRE